MSCHRYAALTAALALAACQQEPDENVAAPSPAPTVTETIAVSAPASPTPSATVGIAPAPDPAVCGADKLIHYLNLLPTSTAKEEIAKTVGHERIRYVAPDDVITMETRPDRLTVELGVDGRIKRFRCG